MPNAIQLKSRSVLQQSSKIIWNSSFDRIMFSSAWLCKTFQSCRPYYATRFCKISFVPWMHLRKIRYCKSNTRLRQTALSDIIEILLRHSRPVPMAHSLLVLCKLLAFICKNQSKDIKSTVTWERPYMKRSHIRKLQLLQYSDKNAAPY